MTTVTDATRTQTMAEFFGLLFGDAISDDLRLGLFALPSKRARHYTSVEKAAEFAAELANTQNVFFNVGLANDRFGFKSKGADIAVLVGVFADIDLVAPHRQDKALPETREQAMALLAALPVPPTLIIDSGYGLQPWWLFRETWILESAEERDRAATLLRGWVGLVQACAASQGWACDSVGDLARVLRPPGSFNHKGREPVEVTLLEAHPERRYNPQDLEDLLPVELEAEMVEMSDLGQILGIPMDLRRTRAIAYLNAMPPAISGQGGHDATYRAAVAVVRGFLLPEDEALAILRAHYNPRCQHEWSEAELRHKVEDAGSKPYPQPEGWLLGTGSELAVLSDDGSAPVHDGSMMRASVVPLGSRDPDTGKLVLSPTRILPTVEAFEREFLKPHGERILHYWCDHFVGWWGNSYDILQERQISRRVLPWLHDALRVYVHRNGNLELIPFESNPGTIESAMKALKIYLLLESSFKPPRWLQKDSSNLPPAEEILVGKSTMLHIPSGRIMAPTPLLFTLNALTFDYDPFAPKPTHWLAFLEQIWGDDQESIQLLQEWFGYCLTPDTRQQKMLMIVGPRRSGKGTIGRILSKLIGEENRVGPTTSSLAGSFGLQPLIGKSLAIVSDARFSGPDLPIVVERLLCISGEDTLTIDRKHMESVSLQLATRLMFLSNELPRLSESSGALAGRFLILTMTNSFFGKEDLGLMQKLEAELPGILNWALDGWRRLHERGYFLQPKSVQDTVEELEVLASPIASFIKECCLIVPEARTTVDEVYDAWCTWCSREGWGKPTTRHCFGRDLKAAAPNVKKCRDRDGYFYQGIGLVEPYGYCQRPA